MQVVTNCIIRQGDQILMLKKPRRGWWVCPGGKMEPGESLVEAVTREICEETGFSIETADLRGVFTVLLQEGSKMIDHWMLFTFYTEKWSGTLLHETEEGILEWIKIDTLDERPMAEGDRIFLRQILQETKLITGKFTYTPDYQLLAWKLENRE
ncbi:putative Nudix hydrolase YvcI [Collibacillus ludicampi]|uniref:Nudix hydrolase YvcI n=1 Tax=Collibacillus ludicampi TaxID=2771369 RepID=A0AAV4LCA6_9BACL|nr:8-oxo-dGTP diphosphatase [Collibacillus ludicampi]GIM45288.1 putative Nudix hydrolase YvcI [Collibacillus ludicampi]